MVTNLKLADHLLLPGAYVYAGSDVLRVVWLFCMAIRAEGMRYRRYRSNESAALTQHHSLVATPVLFPVLTSWRQGHEYQDTTEAVPS